MSQSTAKETVLMRIEIGMDSDTKTAFEDFKAKCSETLDKLSSISVQAKQADGGLLRAIKAEAANDAPAVECSDDAVELKQMGQWVFEDQDVKWQSGGVDCHGRGYLFNCKKESLITPLGGWMPQSAYQWIYIGDGFDNSDYERSLINRLPVNDVDYLSDSIPPIDDVLNQPNWLSDSVTPITETDLQSIFIKNISTVLIQRMHSLDRFSEDDYHVGGDKLMAWDIVIYEPLDTYAVLIDRHRQSKTADLLFFWDAGPAVDADWNTESKAFEVLRTITQDELDAFRTALEAGYVQSK